MSLTIQVPFDSTMTPPALGQGVNPLTFSPMNSPILSGWSTPNTTNTSTGSSVFNAISSSSDVSQLFSLTASAFYSGFSADAKGSVSAYVENNIQATASTIYGYLYTETSTETIPLNNDLIVDPDALTMLQNDLKNHTTDFTDTYGYFFVGGFVYGDWIVGNCSITWESVATKLAMDAQVSAQFNGEVSKGGGAVDAAMQSLASSNNGTISASYMQAGLSGETLLSSFDDLYKTFANYKPGSSTVTPIQLSAICYSWDQVPAIAKILNSTRPPTQLLPAGLTENTLASEKALMANLRSLLNSANSLVSKAQGAYNQQMLASVISGLNSSLQGFYDIAALTDLVTHAGSDQNVVPDLDALFSLVDGGTCGLSFNFALDGNFATTSLNYDQNTVYQFPMSGTTQLAAVTHKDRDGTTSDWALNLVWNNGQFQSLVQPPPDWDENFSGSWADPATAGAVSQAQIVPPNTTLDVLNITSPAYAS